MKKIIGNEDKTLLIQYEQSLNFCEFLSECEKFSLNISVNDFFEIKFTNGNNRIIFRLESLLNKNAELKTAVILHEAIKDPELLDIIKERAAIRWSEGLSDSLFNAVLCNFKPLNEKTECDSMGKIILRPCSDWQEELKRFEV